MESASLELHDLSPNLNGAALQEQGNTERRKVTSGHYDHIFIYIFVQQQKKKHISHCKKNKTL